MARPWGAIVALVALSACAQSPLAQAPDAPDVEIRPVRLGEDGWTLEIVNRTESTVLLPEPAWSGPAVVRYEALQPDGRWEHQGAEHASSFDGEGPSAVYPHESLTLVTEPYMGRTPDEPGTYRATVRLETPDGEVEVQREIAIVGWPMSVALEGEAIRMRAADAECVDVVRDVDRAFERRLEPDALFDVYRDANEVDRRASLLEVMHRRGVFVDSLAEVLTIAPLEEVRALLGAIATSEPDVQPSLRPLAASRSIEVLEADEPLVMDDIRLFTRLQDDWPRALPDALVRRLERGVDHRDHFASLLYVFLGVERHTLLPVRDRVLDALAIRCEAEPEARDLCGSVVRHLGPGLCGGSGFGYSSGCGGVVRRHGACDAIRAEWAALEARAGEVEVTPL
ncbi:MAG: hypothetical protein AB7S26_07220 [Sandaracinaceae bacterium]